MSHFNKGFTLIELLIVLVLIGLTSSVVVPSMWKQFEQTKHKAELSKLKSIAQYCQYYSFYKGDDLQVDLKSNLLVINRLDNGEVVREIVFNTLTFESQSLKFTKKSYFTKKALSIIKINEDKQIKIEL